MKARYPILASLLAAAFAALVALLIVRCAPADPPTPRPSEVGVAEVGRLAFGLLLLAPVTAMACGSDIPGGGARLGLTERTKLRLEARGYWTDLPTELGGSMASVEAATGLAFAWCRSTAGPGRPAVPFPLGGQAVHDCSASALEPG